MVVAENTSDRAVDGARGRRRASRRSAALLSAVLLASTVTCSGASADSSVSSAYTFLAAAMDTCGSGAEQRLPPSFLSGAPARTAPDASYAYDVALTILAFTARGTDDDLARATALGRTLSALQDADPAGDGRVRNVYSCGLDGGAGGAALSDVSTTGNVAWVGLAWLSVYEATGDPGALSSARRAAGWIQATATDPRGTEGYLGGVGPGGSAIMWKSAEHNLDVAAFFARLSAATGEDVWQMRADSALAFVRALQDPATGGIWTGTLDDGVTPNSAHYVPEDVQSWASLIAPSRATSWALDWTVAFLVVADGPLVGAAEGTAPNPSRTIWLEGTAHLALALRVRGEGEDPARAARLLETLRDVQDSELAGSPGGLPAATRDGAAGGSEVLYRAVHVGTTAWYVLAARGVSPFG